MTREDLHSEQSPQQLGEQIKGAYQRYQEKWDEFEADPALFDREIFDRAKGNEPELDTVIGQLLLLPTALKAINFVDPETREFLIGIFEKEDGYETIVAEMRKLQDQ